MWWEQRAWLPILPRWRQSRNARFPRNVSEVRSFVGLAFYDRPFVRDFASIASPLHHLTEKG